MPLSQPSSDSGRNRAMVSPIVFNSLSAGLRKRRSKTRVARLLAAKELRQRLERPPRQTRKVRIPQARGDNRYHEDLTLKDKPEQAKRRFGNTPALIKCLSK